MTAAEGGRTETECVTAATTQLSPQEAAPVAEAAQCAATAMR